MDPKMQAFPINVEAENNDENSLLNTIHRLLSIRNQEAALQEGSLELLDNLPANVLGYKRVYRNESLTILLNFEDKEKVFQVNATECIFKLTMEDQLTNRTIKLNSYSGVILKF
jgi:glycosidase